MYVTKSERGFQFLNHETQLETNRERYSRLANQSSAIGDYKDSMERPGSSFLRIGDYHHLNREEVREFIKHLQAWVTTGSLELPEAGEP